MSDKESENLDSAQRALDDHDPNLAAFILRDTAMAQSANMADGMKK